MKKLISVLLIFSMLSLTVLFSASCNNTDTPPAENGSDSGSNSSENETGTGGEENDLPQIIVPEYKDYGRGTVNFSEMSYERPNIEATATAFSALAKEISEQTIEYGAAIERIKALEAPYSKILTAYAMANIQTAKDERSQFWSEEYKYISTSYGAFAKSIEELFVAAAKSPNAENYEKDYFGEGLIEEYRDGGIYTDEAVSLMATEAEYESEYLTISPETVEITYGGITDKADKILSY